MAWEGRLGTRDFNDKQKDPCNIGKHVLHFLYTCTYLGYFFKMSHIFLLKPHFGTCAKIHFFVSESFPPLNHQAQLFGTQRLKDKILEQRTSGFPFMKTITGADEMRACNLSQKVIIIITIIIDLSLTKWKWNSFLMTANNNLYYTLPKNTKSKLFKDLLLPFIKISACR